MLALDCINIAEQIKILQQAAKCDLTQIGVVTEKRLENVKRRFNDKADILKDIKEENIQVVTNQFTKSGNITIK